MTLPLFFFSATVQITRPLQNLTQLLAISHGNQPEPRWNESRHGKMNRHTYKTKRGGGEGAAPADVCRHPEGADLVGLVARAQLAIRVGAPCVEHAFIRQGHGVGVTTNNLHPAHKTPAHHSLTTLGRLTTLRGGTFTK